MDADVPIQNKRFEDKWPASFNDPQGTDDAAPSGLNALQPSVGGSGR